MLMPSGLRSGWIALVLVAGAVRQGSGRSMSLDINSTCPPTTVVNGVPWPTCYWSQGCVIRPVPNNSYSGTVQDINLVSVNPYSGSIGDVTSMAEPLMRMVLQEVEDMGYLPGYRLNLFLGDSMCTSQDAQVQLVRMMQDSPPKHGLLGDSCTAGCLSTADGAQIYNILTISPKCTGSALTDRARYPNFVRLSTMCYWAVDTTILVIKMLGWKRVGLIWDNTALTIDMSGYFQSRVASDVSDGAYAWALILAGFQQGPSNVPGLVQQIVAQDVRVTVLAMYEDKASLLFCQAFQMGIVSPDRIWVVASGWWATNFLTNWQTFIQQSFKSIGAPSCSPDDMLTVAYGAVLVDRAMMQETNIVHGLSGRKLADIKHTYLQECGAVANGAGLCSILDSGYFYDSLWQWAWLMRQYLIEDKQPLSNLVTPTGRGYLFQKALATNFMGVTGLVRIFGPLDPVISTIYPNATGDRDGTNAIRQVTGVTTLPTVGQWSRSTPSQQGFSWVADFVWSAVDSSRRVPCASGACNISMAWIPSDRNTSCPAGSIYTVNKPGGCVKCSPGTAAKTGDTSCGYCGPGYFASNPGQSSCADCPPGTFGQTVYQTVCASCNRGYYTNSSGLSACTFCKQSTWSDTTGSVACTQCADPLKTTGVVGTAVAMVAAVSPNHCVCGLSTWEDSQGNCVSCRSGMSCPVYGQLYPFLLAGYWSSTTSPSSVYKCSANPDACPGGPPQTCAAGRDPTSIGCTDCLPGMRSNSDGTCSACSSTDGGLIALAIIIGLVVLTGLYLVLDMERPGKQQNGSVLTIIIAFSQLMTVFQQLGILQQITVKWPQPFLSVLSVIMLLNFNIEVLNINCVVSMSPPKRYALRVFFVLMLLVIMAVLHLCVVCVRVIAQRLRGSRSKSKRGSLIKSLGTLLLTFYISIVTQMISPFRCIENPNGISTVVDFPSVPCDVAVPDYVAMVAIGSVAMCVPVSFLAFCVYKVVVQLPQRLRMADMEFLQTYNFLFFRFKNESSNYSPFLMTRNLCMVLIPLVQNSAAKLFLFELLLLPSLCVVAVAKPWRLEAGNYLEMSSLMVVLMIMALGSMMQDASPSAIGGLCLFLFVVAFVCVLVLVLGGAILFLVRRFRKAFKFFICHHKAGAGSFARLLKQRLQPARNSGIMVSSKVFLDCDDLQDLDELFGFVVNTETIVVLCSKYLLTRIWCVGEITTARIHATKIILVAFPDFCMPSDQFIEEYMNIVPDAVDLSAYNMGIGEVQTTLRWFREQPALEVSTPFAASGLQLLMSGLTSSRPTRGIGSYESDVIIFADHDDTEASASAYVLLSLLLPLAVSAHGAPFVLESGNTVPESVNMIILMCSSGFLQKAYFTAAILAAGARGTRIVPVVCEDTFKFPTKAFYRDLDAAATRGTIEGLSSENVEGFIDTIQGIFKDIAVGFKSQSASAKELEAQAKTIAERALQANAGQTRARVLRPEAVEVITSL